MLHDLLGRAFTDIPKPNPLREITLTAGAENSVIQHGFQITQCHNINLGQIPTRSPSSD
jgi:hypothetical protein